LGREKDPFPTNPKRAKINLGGISKRLFALWVELDEGTYPSTFIVMSNEVRHLCFLSLY